MTTFAVLFDLDGVLVDSAPLHAQAYEHVFRSAGFDLPGVARDAIKEGKSRSHVLDLVLPDAEPELRQRLFDAKPVALKAIVAEHADCIISGAPEAIRGLARAGVAIAVVTNSRAPEIWMDKIGVANQIDLIISGDDVSSPKPSAEGYLLGARRLGVPPERCIVIEDSHDGWVAATRAGMRVALVAKERPRWAPSDTEVMPQPDATTILRLLGITSATRP